MNEWLTAPMDERYDTEAFYPAVFLHLFDNHDIGGYLRWY